MMICQPNFIFYLILIFRSSSLFDNGQKQNLREYMDDDEVRQEIEKKKVKENDEAKEEEDEEE